MYTTFYPSSSYASSDTGSYNSECDDDEEIALAIQAAEIAARTEARARFKNSKDLIHRLFVCISGEFLYCVVVVISMTAVLYGVFSLCK